jgi:hypothetical protein
MSVTNYLIPLINEPQAFEITLASIDYMLTCKWNNQTDAGWVLDIADALGNPIACNIPLITGADCLEGLQYLGLGGSIYVLTNGAKPNDVPTLDNLGMDSNAYFQVVA